MDDLEKQSDMRRQKLSDNSAFLQFNWKANVVESWIGGVFLHRFQIVVQVC